MELMSSLLLCVLVVLLPQTSGRSGIRPATEIKFNNSLVIHQKPNLRKHVLLNINGPPLVNNASELQSVFTDFFCKSCHRCMERAIKADKAHFHIISHRPSSEELQEDVLLNEISYRTKRDIPPTDQTLPEVTGNVADETTAEPKTTKKTKTRKHKANKSVTVTKYNMDGEVYALRVKETQVTTEKSNGTKPLGTCQVYNVKKSYPCESPESETLLVAARRRAGKKKSKRQEQEKTKPNDAPNSTTAKVRVHLQTSIFKKREVDNSEVPENFMPSIEDLY